jgi:hypothetical protein
MSAISSIWKIFRKNVLFWFHIAMASGGRTGLQAKKAGGPVRLVMSTIPKRKYKRSDIEANYQNETKTFWCVPKNEVERFYLVQKRNNNVFMCTRTF